MLLSPFRQTNFPSSQKRAVLRKKGEEGEKGRGGGSGRGRRWSAEREGGREVKGIEKVAMEWEGMKRRAKDDELEGEREERNGGQA